MSAGQSPVRLSTLAGLVLLGLLLPACEDTHTPASDRAPPADVRTLDLRPLDLSAEAAPDLLRCPDAVPDQPSATATVSGDAMNFLGPPWYLVGTMVSLVENPCVQRLTDAKGHYVFSGLPVGSEVTLALVHKDFHPIRTATITLGSAGADRFSFQAVDHLIFKAMGALAGAVPDEAHACQIASTVTRIGKSVYDPGAHGEAGATVTLSPSLPASHGPVYFNTMVLPDKSLTETSEDGGVLFSNVPPGRYTLTAHKTGVKFRPVVVTCHAGWLVNASPPWGLQAIP